MAIVINKQLLLKFKALPLIMVYRRNILCGERWESYFHVKILLLVFPDLCKNFETLSADKLLMAKVIFGIYNYFERS